MLVQTPQASFAYYEGAIAIILSKAVLCVGNSASITCIRPGCTLLTLREPPNSRQATASLIFSPPKICGAMRLNRLATASGRAANSLNSASSSCLRACQGRGLRAVSY